MARVVLAMLLFGCGSQAKKPDPPTPAEQTPDEPNVAPLGELESPTGPAAKQQGSTQAEIAAATSQEGIDLMNQDNYAGASAKFRDAVARVPEPKYFFNLCVSLYFEGRFSEALAACNAVSSNTPTPQLETKAKTMSARIRAEAARQEIELE